MCCKILYMKFKKGFTLLEILIVITVIVILAVVILSSLSKSRERTYYGRVLSEFQTMDLALQMYKFDNNETYPADVNRDLPPGLEKYVTGGENENWPKAPWPGSVYDWDNWPDPNNPDQRIYQISIRFCPLGGDISTCKFPKESWAQNFGVNSAVYYCIDGECRAHQYESVNYPGYCVNCNESN